MPHRPCKVFGADIFTTKNNTSLCIIDYYSKFSVVKKTDSLSADNLIRADTIVFTEFRLPKKIISDVGTNLVSENFKQFCRQLNSE